MKILELDLMSMLSLASNFFIQWPLVVLQLKKKPCGPRSIFPIDQHYKRDVCKTVNSYYYEFLYLQKIFKNVEPELHHMIVITLYSFQIPCLQHAFSLHQLCITKAQNFRLWTKQ